MINTIIAQNFFTTLEKIEHGSIKITTPEDNIMIFEGKLPGEKADLKLNKWSVITRLAYLGDIAFAEDYRDENFTTNNLLSLLQFALANDKILGKYINSNILLRWIYRLGYYINSNSIKQSARNIYKHYDLGNSFYKLWLDESMSYSSAIFKTPGETLQNAQYNKYDRIIDRMANGVNILEIGCGWGGFVDRAMQKKDLNIKAITLSNAQYQYAQNRVGNIADIAIEDYRNQDGKYDNIVSIEMFEAVGKKYWPIYFAKIKHLLKNKGKALIQTITIRDDLFDHYNKGSDMVRSFIFPGGILPSDSQFINLANNANLKINDIYKFGQDYAKTLELWLEKFDNQYNAIREMGFDDKFIKIWRFYLASCAACFKSKRTNVIQVELQNDVKSKA